ncbi:DUF4189 domain-containing protein [Luteimonas soli]|uniref:DUF4189 domain-containing protein n=1 Tax=Luteimonas soli TaxID=1648966 RepID=A0ABV7XGG6_9GAMM
MLFLATGFASAQTACPQGVAAGSAQCGPSSLVNPGSAADYVQPVPKIKWESSWGAIASDNKGIFGILTDLPSRRSAKKAAVEECRRRGGDGCSVNLVFKNQCAAVGASDENAFASGAPTIEEATARAMQRCRTANGEGECRVFYAGCSMAKRVW